MKIVYYINNAGCAIPVAVSAWSVRSRGNLPTQSQYILYTDDEECFKDPILTKVFDDVQYTPYDKDWFDNLPWGQFPWGTPDTNAIMEVPVNQSAFGGDVSKLKEYTNVHRSRKTFWARFTSFLKTLCDGDMVLQFDWDMLCLHGISGIVPPYPYTWSAYRRGACSYNNGFTLKTPEFDKEGGSECMLEPLEDPEKYTLAFNVHPSGDEVGPAWYELSRGHEDVWSPDVTFNYSAPYAIENNVDIRRRGVRLLHYGYLSKPWMKYVDQKSPVVEVWWDALREMCVDIEEEVPDVGLSS